MWLITSYLATQSLFQVGRTASSYFLFLMRSLPFFSLLLFLAPTVVAQAQQPAPALTFGVKAGASLTSLTNRNLESSRYLAGFHAGITSNFAFTPAFSLQAEALYSQKGVRDDLRVSRVQYDNRQRLHYLDVPLLARLHAGDAFVEVGPQFGVLLAARGHYEGPGTETGDETVTDYFNRVDVGYAAGIGYQIPGGPGLGLRYNGGFLNAVRQDFSVSTMRNSAFQFYLSYQLRK